MPFLAREGRGPEVPPNRAAQSCLHRLWQDQRGVVTAIGRLGDSVTPAQGQAEVGAGPARPTGEPDRREQTRRRLVALQTTALILYNIYIVFLRKIGMMDPDARLLAAAAVEDRAERTLRVATAVAAALTEAGSHPVLVGGGAVEIYTRSAYTTRDLDFVAAVTSASQAAMLELGFEQQGRHWVHRRFGIVVAFPAATLWPAEAVSIEVDGSELQIISVVDLIVDRLASWKHWGWDPDGAAAVLLMAAHSDCDATRLRDRAVQEDVADALVLLQPLAEDDGTITDRRLRELRAQLQD